MAATDRVVIIVPNGPEVATAFVTIAHETGNHLIECTGEVVVSGPNVTLGYESYPLANAQNVFDADGVRWFRTGDC